MDLFFILSRKKLLDFLTFMYHDIYIQYYSLVLPSLVFWLAIPWLLLILNKSPLKSRKYEKSKTLKNQKWTSSTSTLENSCLTIGLVELKFNVRCCYNLSVPAKEAEDSESNPVQCQTSSPLYSLTHPLSLQHPTNPISMPGIGTEWQKSTSFCYTFKQKKSKKGKIYLLTDSSLPTMPAHKEFNSLNTVELMVQINFQCFNSVVCGQTRDVMSMSLLTGFGQVERRFTEALLS